MKIRFCLLLLLAALTPVALQAQSPVYAQPQNPDAVANISAQLTTIAKSVQTMNDRFKSFLEKFGSISGPSLTEKQQKVIMGLDILVRAEQRVASLQMAQIDFTEKLNDTRAKLSQIDLDLRPHSIENSQALQGGTDTEERRESRRQKLQADRTSLTQLATQIQISLADTSETLRDAQATANRLRRIYLPQIEAEIGNQ